jgi:[protein-PII] uridylyltransferase
MPTCRVMPMRVRECSEHALALLMNEGVRRDRRRPRLGRFPAIEFLRHRPEQIAWQTRAILDANGAVAAGRRASLVGTWQHRAVCLHPRSRWPVCHGHRRAGSAALLGDGVAHPQLADGMALDTFLLLEADTSSRRAPRALEELHQRLQRELAHPHRMQPCKRSMSRHQKHFQMPPRIISMQADDRTQLALVGARTVRVCWLP